MRNKALAENEFLADSSEPKRKKLTSPTVASTRPKRSSVDGHSQNSKDNSNRSEVHTNDNSPTLRRSVRFSRSSDIALNIGTPSDESTHCSAGMSKAKSFSPQQRSPNRQESASSVIPGESFKFSKDSNEISPPGGLSNTNLVSPKRLQRLSNIDETTLSSKRKSPVSSKSRKSSTLAGACNLCPKDTAQFDDIKNHYMTFHCAVYSEDPPGYLRDAAALDSVLSTTGKLTCQFCARIFSRSGFGLLHHERKCLRNPRRAAELEGDSFDFSVAPRRDVAVDELVNGCTIPELEKIHAKQGFLKCNACSKDYRSPVSYFLKHVKQCGKVESESETEETSIVPGQCMFCPIDDPPVEDLLQHYAFEHLVLYTANEPGWLRSAEALDKVCRIAGKLSCNICESFSTKSGSSLLLHENRCISKRADLRSIGNENSDRERLDSISSGNSIEHTLSHLDLEQIKSRDGFLMCPKCKVNQKGSVQKFTKHVNTCLGAPREVPKSEMILALAQGQCCGREPFICKLCKFGTTFSSAEALQGHYMQRHASIYAPDWPDGIRTQKVREIILKKYGKLVCPNCEAVYKLVPSFVYHEKTCLAVKNSEISPESFEALLEKPISGPVRCKICSETEILDPSAVHAHFMETHCAIYFPESGLSGILESKEVYEFILQRLGYLRCDKCSRRYRCPPWFFRRHRLVCNADSDYKNENEDGDKDLMSLGPKTRRKAARKAMKRIGRLEKVEGDTRDDEAADNNFDGSLELENSEDDEDGDGSDSLAPTTDEEQEKAKKISEKITKPVIKTNIFYPKPMRDISLKKCMIDLKQEWIRKIAESTVPSRLKNLKPEFTKWKLEKTDHFCSEPREFPLFRFGNDPSQPTQTFSGLTGQISTDISLQNNEAVFFVGGRVYAMDCTMRATDSIWFAISADSSPDPDTRLASFKPSTVQLWHFPLSSSSSPSKPPTLEYSIAINYGPVLALQFCPAASLDVFGLSCLAIGGCGPNLISIVSLPTELSGKTTGAVYHPFISLKLRIQNIEPDLDNSQTFLESNNFSNCRVIAMDWSPDGSTLVAGLSDSSVAIWKFDSNSPLLSSGDDTSLLAARVFRAHSLPLVSVRLAPFTQKAVITLAIDGTLSLFSTINGCLLNTMIFPYSTQLALMPGCSIPVIVNNPWNVLRRNVTEQNNQKGSTIVSSLSAVDLFGENPASDTYPFSPILHGGPVSCIASIRPQKSANDSIPIVLGFVTGSLSGDVRIYTTSSHLLKVRLRGSVPNITTEKWVASSETNENIIQLISSRNQATKQIWDPLGMVIAPPDPNSINMISALQLPGEASKVLVVSAMTCGIVRLNFVDCPGSFGSTPKGKSDN